MFRSMVPTGYDCQVKNVRRLLLLWDNAGMEKSAMTKPRYYTDEQARVMLRKRCVSQTELAKHLRVTRQNVSAMLNGAPLHGKVLEWLGFRRVKGLLERIP